MSTGDEASRHVYGESDQWAPTGPLTYDRLRELGLPSDGVDRIEARERDQLEQLRSRQAEGREFIRDCGTDPDDRQAVRALYEDTRQSHIAWLRGHGGIDRDAYYTLVDAIRAAFLWVHWPLGWPAPHLVLMDRPLRNLLPRRTQAG